MALLFLVSSALAGGTLIAFLLGWLLALVAGALIGMYAVQLQQERWSALLFLVTAVALVISCGGFFNLLTHIGAPYATQADYNTDFASTFVPPAIPPVTALVALFFLRPRQPKLEAPSS